MLLHDTSYSYLNIIKATRPSSSKYIISKFYKYTKKIFYFI